MANRSNETIGRLGEIALEKWAAEAHLVANRSNDDRAGWDYFIELPPERALSSMNASPFNTEVFPLRARVQVKATDSQPGYRDIELSNWVRMIEEPNPSFFLIIELNGKNDPERAFLVHVSEDLIRAVLKRVHENNIGDQRPLNKLTMRLYYSTQHELSNLNGSTLLSKIKEPIKPSAAEYAKWKANLVQDAGYESGNVFVKLTIPNTTGEDPRSMIAKLEIGLIDRITYDRLEMYATRFDQPASEPFKRVDGGEVFVPERTATTQVQIRLASGATGKRAKIDAEMFAPTGLALALQQGESISPYNVLFRSPFFHFIVNIEKRSGSVEIKLPQVSQRVTVRDLHHIKEIVHLLVGAHEADDEVVMDIYAQSGRFIQFAMNASELVKLDLQELMYPCFLFDLAWHVAKDFDIQDELEVSVAELFDAAHQLQYVSSLIKGDIPEGSLSFSLVQNDSPESREYMRSLEENELVVLHPYEVSLGNFRVVVVLSLKGYLRRIGIEGNALHFTISSPSPEILEKDASPNAEPPPLSHYELTERASKKLSHRFLAVISPPSTPTGSSEVDSIGT